MPKRILRPLLAATVLLVERRVQFTHTHRVKVWRKLTYNGAPQIKIVSPQANARYREGTNVYIVARVENAGPDINSMIVRIGDERLPRPKPDTGGGCNLYD